MRKKLTPPKPLRPKNGKTEDVSVSDQIKSFDVGTLLPAAPNPSIPLTPQTPTPTIQKRRQTAKKKDDVCSAKAGFNKLFNFAKPSANPLAADVNHTNKDNVFFVASVAKTIPSTNAGTKTAHDKTIPSVDAGTETTPVANALVA